MKYSVNSNQYSVGRENPKGIPQQSPGLRAASYPGKTPPKNHNPEWVAESRFPNTSSSRTAFYRMDVDFEKCVRGGMSQIPVRVLQQGQQSRHSGPSIGSLRPNCECHRLPEFHFCLFIGQHLEKRRQARLPERGQRPNRSASQRWVIQQFSQSIEHSLYSRTKCNQSERGTTRPRRLLVSVFVEIPRRIEASQNVVNFPPPGWRLVLNPFQQIRNRIRSNSPNCLVNFLATLLRLAWVALHPLTQLLPPYSGSRSRVASATTAHTTRHATALKITHHKRFLITRQSCCASPPTQARTRRLRIPTGFRNKAQGCDNGATLGPARSIHPQPQRGCAPQSHSLSCLATTPLGL